jgi:hypothetical protein
MVSMGTQGDPYDIAFLSLQQGVVERGPALECLDAVAAKQASNALEAALQGGLIDAAQADHFHALATQAQGTGPKTDDYLDLAVNGEGLDDYALGPLLGRGVWGSS